jgi:hypothetical protein
MRHRSQTMAAAFPDSSLGRLRVAFRTLIELLLALDPAKVKGLPLKGGCCRGILRVDFHSAHRITDGRRLAFHDSLLKVACMTEV